MSMPFIVRVDGLDEAEEVMDELESRGFRFDRLGQDLQGWYVQYSLDRQEGSARDIQMPVRYQLALLPGEDTV